jgi:co-chaperonin GroES (HSP10)
MNTIEEFEPLADQVVVEPLRQLERFGKMSHGLHVADNPNRDKQREFHHLGRVIKCGPGDLTRDGLHIDENMGRRKYLNPKGGRWPMHVQAGDLVLYERRPTAVIILDGRQFLVLHEEQHITAVVEGMPDELTAPAYDPKLGDLVV